MNRVVIGILAHVDSGKTTLSEGMLYSAGEIRKIGRVDHGDAFLDSHEIERDKCIIATHSRSDSHVAVLSF